VARAQAALLVAAILLACDGSSGSRGSGCRDGGACAEQQATVLFEPSQQVPLDVLLVVDPVALAGRADHLRATLRALGPYLHTRFDTQVAVISAREDALPGGALSLWPPGAASCLHAGEGFLRDPATCGQSPNYDGALDDQLACPIVEGAAPAVGPGRPLAALVRLLSGARSDPAARFLRPEAGLAVGIFTAGDDPDAAGPTGAVVRAGLVRLKGDRPELVSVHAFVALPDDQPCADPQVPPERRAPGLTAFLQQFPAQGLSTSCDGDWPGRFQQVIPSLLAIRRVFCLPGPLADRDPGSPGVQPECVLEELPAGAATPASRTTIVPACAAGTDAGAAPCWRAEPDIVCESGLRLEVPRTCAPARGTVQRLTCATRP
jgi:hypothetical protein